MTEFLTTTTENAVVADLARRAVAPETVDIVPDRLRGVVVNGVLTQVDLDQYLDNPRRATGHPNLTNQNAFIEYVNRHLDHDTTTIWSDVDHGTFTAVIDDHGITNGDANGKPGYGQHRATLKLKNSPDWDHWLKQNGQMLGQQAFAEHIEDGTDCITKPAAADMLELAQSFQANTKVDFESGDRLQSGQVDLVFKETVTARAGQTGHIEIPTMIELELQVFEAGAKFRINARFMFRINDGKLTLGYRLIRPDVARKAAFDDVSAGIAKGVGLQPMSGTPRSS